MPRVDELRDERRRARRLGRPPRPRRQQQLAAVQQAGRRPRCRTRAPSARARRARRRPTSTSGTPCATASSVRISRTVGEPVVGDAPSCRTIRIGSASSSRRSGIVQASLLCHTGEMPAYDDRSGNPSGTGTQKAESAAWRSSEHFINGREVARRRAHRPGLQPGHRRAAARGGVRVRRRGRAGDRRGEGGPARLARHQPRSSAPTCSSGCATCSSSARPSSPPSSRASTARCSPMPRARSRAASRTSSSPPGSCTCSRASTPSRSRAASTCTPSSSPSASSAPSRPFNFPVMVPLWMVASAIACGNTVVLKPSEKDPSASVFLAEAVPGGGPARRRAQRRARRQGRGRRDPRLPRRARPSPSSARRRSRSRSTSARRANGKRVQALGGAKNHMVVMPDADLDGRSGRRGLGRLRLGRRALHGRLGARRGRRRRRRPRRGGAQPAWARSSSATARMPPARWVR